MDRLWGALKGLQWVDRKRINPNDYNPNKVSNANLELLTVSVYVNGFTMPVVCRPDLTIIDGFHRYTIFGPEWTYIPEFEENVWRELGYGENERKTLYELSGGKIPVVIVSHDDESMYVYGTVTHNRARGAHLLEPMKAIVKRLIAEGKDVKEIGQQLGMKPEEVFRLSDFSKDDFLAMMVGGNTSFSNAQFITRI